MITNKDLNNEYSLFARNIKLNREKLKMTQEELAEKADISISYIKQIERGKDYKNLSLTIMLKLSKALNVTEESKDKIKAELERRNKEVDLVRQMSEVEEDISKLETEATNSISYFKFWINVVLESLFLIIFVAIIVLYIISQFNPNFDFAIWFKSLGVAIIVPFLTTCTHMKNLYIFAPRVAKNDIRKKQLETWYDRHAEYKLLTARKMTLQKAIDGVSTL